jgi:signal transduction histidine kinase
MQSGNSPMATRPAPAVQEDPPPRGERAETPAPLAQALEAHPDGFAIADREGRLAAHNRRLFEVWGFPAEEVSRIEALGPTAEARLAFVEAAAARVADPESFRAGVARMMAIPDEVAKDELTLRDGRILERHSAPTRDAGGRVSGRLAFFRDITGRARAEVELRDRARKQAAVAAIGELAMCTEALEPLLHAACATVRDTLDLDAVVLFERTGPGDGVAVRAASGLDPSPVGRVLEATPASQVGTVLASPEAAAVRDAEAGWPEDRFLRQHGLCCGATVPLHGRDGPVGALGAYLRGPRRSDGDDVRFLEAVASVLSAAIARHRAEAVVIEGERQMRAVFDAALDAMLIVGADGLVLDANPAARTLFAASRSGLLGRLLRDLTGASRGLLDEIERRWRSLDGRGRIQGVAEIARPGQPPRSVELFAIGQVLPGRHLLVLRDVTERRQLHARLALADRMVSVGTLAAGVAHELNNPLAYVSANLAFVAERLARLEPSGTPDPDLLAQLDDAVRDAREGAERMRVIVRDLRTFSRAEEDRVGPVNLLPVLESCINMAWNEIKHRARLTRDLAPVPPVTGNQARLGQVFLNLLVNAAQAIPEGRASENEIAVRTRPLGDGRLAVEIRDTGCGIAPENLERIFDPFFTTKPPGVGTGLGLPICHSIVASHGGEIEVESAPGRGSTFRILLRADGAASEAASSRSPAPPRPRGRILVVDDEPLVGTVIQRSLQGQHQVEFAPSARAALAMLEAGRTFDAVLSDLLMPEMSGMDLYREIRRRDPRLAERMVFLTGGAFTPAASDFLANEPVECIEKPFEIEAIRAVIARKLAAP